MNPKIYISVFLFSLLMSIGGAFISLDQHQLFTFQNIAYAAETVLPDAEYDSAMRAARGRIEKYEAAVKSGNADRVRKATLELQSDPLAVREINQTKSNAWKKSFKSQVSRIQVKAKQIARQNIARAHGVSPNQVTFFEATNPPKIDPATGEIIQKVGQDWDFTARIDGKDVKVKGVKQIVHDAYHEAATGERPPSPKGMSKVEHDRAMKGYNKRANQTAHKQALEVLNSTSDEAYAGAKSEGNRVLSGPKDQRVRDPQQLSKVIEHKSNKAAENAAEFRKQGDTNRAAGADMEQFRQADKQIQKQVKPRVEARGGKVPEHLKKGAAIIKDVADGKISPKQGDAKLAKMGETRETMIRKNAELFEASQKLESPKEVLKRAKAGKTPPDVLTENVQDSLDLKRAKARASQPKSLQDGGKSSFQGDTPPDTGPKSTLAEVRAKAEARLQAEKLRTGKSINRPKSMLDGGKSSVGTAETPVVKGSELAEAANAEKGLVKSGSKKATSSSTGKTAGAVSESAAAEAAAGKIMSPELTEMAKTGKRPASLLEGGKASSSHLPKPPSKAAQLDQAVGGRLQKAMGIGEVPESSSSLRKGFTKKADKAMGAVAVAATAHEGYEAGHEFGEGLVAKRKADEYREKARKARESGNITVADKLDKRAGEYEAEASKKMSAGAQDEALLVGTLAVAGTATGGAALAGYGAYKTGEAAYGAGKSLSEGIVEEEFEREVAEAQKEGRAASATSANAKAGARIIGEVTGARAVMEWGMGDSKKDQQHSEDEQKLISRRNKAIADLNEGLDNIAGIEKDLRNLNSNPNQDDPWVKQRRQELQDQYDAERTQLQNTNRRLKGESTGASKTIRDAVALLPEKPDAGQAPEGDDELTTAMVTHQSSAEETAKWEDQGAADPDSQTGKSVTDFSRTDAAGNTAADQKKQSGSRVTSNPDDVKKKDVEEERKEEEEQERQADEKRSDQQRIEEDKFSSDWNDTVQNVNDSLSKLNEQDALKVKNMTEAAIKLIQQMKSGAISDDSFTTQMAALENQHAALQKEGQDEWQKIQDRLTNNHVNDGGAGQTGGNNDSQCANDFTMNSNTEFSCNCPGYSFDYSWAKCMNKGGGTGNADADPVSTILGSVPQDQIDVRNVMCDTKSESGGDTPASITVGLGGTTGTAHINYDLYSVKDRLIVQHKGKTIHDTGCTNGDSSIDVPISTPGGQLHVVIQPACDGSGTSWNFTVSCPGGSLSGN